MIETLWMIAFEFFKTGLFAVGGGLATIPFLAEMAEKYGWFTAESLSTMIAVSESTPGPMGINMATYVGYSVSGVLGALISTLSLVAPSVIVITIIANYFQKFKDAAIVKMIFSGLKPAVVAFIAAACLSLFVSTLLKLGGNPVNFADYFNWKGLVLLAIMLAVQYKYPKLHPIVFILAAALIGIIFKF